METLNMYHATSARSIRRALFSLTATIGLFLTVTKPACADTIVPAGSIVGQTWTLAGSPYVVTGDITALGLTINPGVEVAVEPGVRISVGAIFAVGTIEQPIVFRQAVAGSAWKGLEFSNIPPGSQLIHCNFSGSDDSALRIVNNVPEIRLCRFEANSHPSRGGAIDATLAVGQILRLEDCVFVDNQSNPNPSVGVRRGGAVYVSGDCEILNCFFGRNTVNSASGQGNQIGNAMGGALYAEAGNLSLANSVFSKNVARVVGTGGTFPAQRHARGGAVYISGSTVTAKNLLIGCNTTSGTGVSHGAGLYAASGSVDLDNVTIARNNTQAVYNASATVTITNSVLYENASGGAQTSGVVAVSFSNVQGIASGGDNQDFDPFFAGTGCEACDMEITRFSPSVDAGDPAAGFDDGSLPPGLGTSRNDQGHRGGPGNVNGSAGEFGMISEFCFGDGGDQMGCTNCPCGNNAAPGTIGGCLNSAGRGAHLQASGFPSVANDTLRFEVTGASSSTLAVLISACNALPVTVSNPCTGQNSGVTSISFDGLRCVGGNIRRHGGRMIDANGDVGITTNGWGPPNGPAAGIIASRGFTEGQTRNFQVIYRDDNLAQCMTGLNTSQAVRVTVAP